MLLGRFVPIVRRARDRRLAREEEDRARLGGHVPHRRRDVLVLLVGVIVLTAGLMIFPRSTLGPIVEGLMH